MKISNRKKFLLVVACVTVAGFNFFVYAQNNNPKNIAALDSDSDGLTDSEEKTYSTDPSSSDSDGDGYSDAVEIKSGYDPLKKAPGDKIVSKKLGSGEKSESTELIDKMSENFQALVASKNNQEVSMDDLDGFIESNLEDKIGPAPTFETLPEIDQTKIKIKQQAYQNLNPDERREQEKKDLETYLKNFAILIISNLPETNPVTFWQTFQDKLEGLTSLSPDYQYFRDLGDKMQIIQEQGSEMEVPEQIVQHHVKFLRLLAGYVAIKNDKSLPNVENPVGNVVVITKIQAMTPLITDFFTDFGNYASQLK